MSDEVVKDGKIVISYMGFSVTADCKEDAEAVIEKIKKITGFDRPKLKYKIYKGHILEGSSKEELNSVTESLDQGKASIPVINDIIEGIRDTIEDNYELTDNELSKFILLNTCYLKTETDKLGYTLDDELFEALSKRTESYDDRKDLLYFFKEYLEELVIKIDKAMESLLDKYMYLG